MERSIFLFKANKRTFYFYFIFLNYIFILGEEESVTECVHEPWGEGNCRHDEDVAVECFVDDNIPAVLAGSDVRLEHMQTNYLCMLLNKGF